MHFLTSNWTAGFSILRLLEVSQLKEALGESLVRLRGVLDLPKMNASRGITGEFDPPLWANTAAALIFSREVYAHAHFKNVISKSN